MVGFRGRRGAEGRSGPVHRAVSAEENGTAEQRSARHRDLFPPGVVYTELHQRFSGRKEKKEEALFLGRFLSRLRKWQRRSQRIIAKIRINGQCDKSGAAGK